MLLAMTLCVSACSLALDQPTVMAGRWFPQPELAHVQTGASGAEVRRVAGEPLETTKSANGERWRYSMTVKREEHVWLLGAVPLPPRRSVRTWEVVLLVRDDVVVDVTVRDWPSTRATPPATSRRPSTVPSGR
jgi:hypothetical protein